MEYLDPVYYVTRRWKQLHTSILIFEYIREFLFRW